MSCASSDKVAGERVRGSASVAGAGSARSVTGAPGDGAPLGGGSVVGPPGSETRCPELRDMMTITAGPRELGGTLAANAAAPHQLSTGCAFEYDGRVQAPLVVGLG